MSRLQPCFLFVVAFVAVAQGRSVWSRVKRQLPIAVHRPQGDYQHPFYEPYPGQSASVLAPVFPLTGHFTNGLEVNPGTQTIVDGALNIPLPGWGIWDFKGGLKTGNVPTRVGVGVLGGPVNPLGLTPESLATLGANPLFQQARGVVEPIPVARLPGNYVPVVCKPPLCNPFIGKLGVGVEVEPGDDAFFDGGLDFPVPIGPAGLGYRFPLSGGINAGTVPVVVTYGQGLGPVDPFRNNPPRNARPAPLPATQPPPPPPPLFPDFPDEAPSPQSDATGDGFEGLPPVPFARDQVIDPFEGFPALFALR